MKATITFDHDVTGTESKPSQEPIVLSSGDRVSIGYVDKIVYGGDEDYRTLTFQCAQRTIEIAMPESIWKQLIAGHLGGDATLFGKMIAGEPEGAALLSFRL